MKCPDCKSEINDLLEQSIEVLEMLYNFHGKIANQDELLLKVIKRLNKCQELINDGNSQRVNKEA